MSLEQNKPLTNPFADSTNVIKVRIAETGDCEFLPLDLALAINTGATTATFTNNLSAQPLYKVLSVRMTDGNEESVSIYDPSTLAAFTIDTTIFDVSKDWLVEFFYAPSVSLGADCPCQKSFTYEIKGAKASFAKSFVSSQAVAVLEVEVNDTVIADGAAFTFPAASLNDVILAEVKLKNTGVANLDVQNISLTGDASFVGYAQKNGSLPESGEYVYVTVQLDTSSIGAKTSTVTIATDEAANPIYTVDIDVTVA